MNETGAAAVSAPPAPMGPAAAMSPRAERLRACRRRSFLHALAGAAFLLLVAVGFAVRLAARGLPDSWAEALSDRISTDAFSVELSGVSFSLADMELRVAEAHVYPKGVVQEPFLHASGTRVRLHPRRGAPPVEWVSSVDVHALSVSLPDDSASTPDDDDAPVAVADFPPLAFTCRMADVMGLKTHFTSGTVSCTGGVVRVDGARTDLHAPREARQRMEGFFECDPARMSFKSGGKGRIDPAKLDALLRTVGAPAVADEIARFAFGAAPPEADAAYEYDPAADVRSLRIGIRADGGGTYNGVPFSKASATLCVGGTDSWSRVDVENLVVHRPEGTFRGSLAFDLDAERLRFEGFSTIDPALILAMVGAVKDPADLPVAFDNPTEASAEGVVALGEDQSGTAISLRLASPGVSVPDVPGLRFDRARAEGAFTNMVLDLESFGADALGGAATGSLRVELPAGDRDETMLHGAWSLRGASHAAWSALFLGNEIPEDAGRADADATFDGPAADLTSLEPVRSTGTMSVDLYDVPVFRVPFFSGLRDFLSSNLSVFDPLADDFLHMDARLDGDVVKVDSLRIEGGAISITGDGNVWTDRVVNLGVKVHLMNRRSWVGTGIYYLFSPISSIFALRATGSLDDPNWDPEAIFLSGTDVKPAVAPPPEGAGKP